MSEVLWYIGLAIFGSVSAHYSRRSVAFDLLCYLVALFAITAAVVGPLPLRQRLGLFVCGGAVVIGQVLRGVIVRRWCWRQHGN